MEARELLERLSPPDPAGQARVWRRFQETRAGQERSRMSLLIPLFVGACAAAVAAVMLMPERERDITLDATTDTVVHRWSDQIELRLDGHGRATGTGRNVVVNWEAGTVWVEVEPNSGSALSVITDEAKIEVVGTAFSVTRDPLGVTTAVSHGTVAVTCDDGWSGSVTAASGPHTCWPVRPAALKARSDELLKRGAPHDLALATLVRGLEVADPQTPYYGELLVGRAELLVAMGRTDEAVADAERYLATGEPTRRTDVGRLVGRTLLASGCEQALRWLEIAADGESTAQDRVVLASCLAHSDPTRALSLARDALASGESIDEQWRAWAQTLTDGGER